ncbi:hypothetical protein METH_15240 [Leisingera methylohalidivorans DSM 14336]|uniref:Uncharacterized protein n=1 Tax=Leisingera methylohalidivorans DSM 14336 TaxID=999552 RepID=V9VZE6_9RHOB|nr:hypothetical protein METH_15240 [Leisingera methylohalidivorans DSM 14336]
MIGVLFQRHFDAGLVSRQVVRAGAHRIGAGITRPAVRHNGGGGFGHRGDDRDIGTGQLYLQRQVAGHFQRAFGGAVASLVLQRAHAGRH